MTNTPAGATAKSVGPRGPEQLTKFATAVPYLAIALLLWATSWALLAWAPAGGTGWGLLVSWAYSQAQILNTLLGSGTAFPLAGIWVGSYLLLGLATWILIERRELRRAKEVWKRALIAWLVLLGCYIAVLAVHGQAGILHE